MANLRQLVFALTAVVSLGLGCSSSSGSPEPQGGSSQPPAESGGSVADSGSTVATGGSVVTSSSVATGGSVVTGGTPSATGGVAASGGASKGGTTGGASETGGSTGGIPGGSSSTTGGAGGDSSSAGGSPRKPDGGVAGAGGGAGGASGGMGGAAGRGGGRGGASASGGAGGTVDGGAVGGATGPIPDAAPVDPNKKITLWMVGDSTMQNCQSSGLCGWAAEFQQYCGPNVTVSNQARGGRSIQTWIWGDPNVSKTATDANGECQVLDKTTYSDNLTTMLDPTKGMQPGDWVYVAFGINDAGGTCNRHVGTALFQSDLDFMATTIRSKGANPIFGTSTSGQQCSGSTNTPNRAFGPETKAAGAADNVPVIDLLTLSVALYNSLKLCPGGSSTFWADGRTHFTAQGATQVAAVVAQAIKDQGIGLAAYLK